MPFISPLYPIAYNIDKTVFKARSQLFYILSKLNLTKTAEFTGITVYNSQGSILAKFDANGNLTSGSKTVDLKNSDNHKLHVAIEPLGTHYTYDISYVNSDNFSSDFFDIDANLLTSKGKTSFDIAINAPVK